MTAVSRLAPSFDAGSTQRFGLAHHRSGLRSPPYALTHGRARQRTVAGIELWARASGPSIITETTERVGFEPTSHLVGGYTLSKRAPSASQTPLPSYLVTDGMWRRGWDSNPREPCGPTAFRERRLQPDSSHLSGKLESLMLYFALVLDGENTEEAGFEPAGHLRGQRFSRPPLSAAQPLLQLQKQMLDDSRIGQRGARPGVLQRAHE